MLKTLGFGDGRVQGMVLMESCVLALVGGLAGLALAWILVLDGDPTGGFLPSFYFPVRDLFVGVLIVLALGFAAGAIPAWQAGRLRIVDALRYRRRRRLPRCAVDWGGLQVGDGRGRRSLVPGVNIRPSTIFTSGRTARPSSAR